MMNNLVGRDRMEEDEGKQYQLEESGSWRRCAGRFTGPAHGLPNSEAHYRKHVVIQQEWEDRPPNVSAYVDQASNFLNRTDVYELYDQVSKSIVKYSIDTNELGMATEADGHIRTFFRPRVGPLHVERRLQSGEWVPYAALEGEWSWAGASDSDDDLAERIRGVADELIAQLEVVQYEALAAVQARIGGRLVDMDEGKSIGAFLVCLGFLEAAAHTARSVASTQDQETVARELAGTVEEWRGVRDVVEEGLGVQMIELIVALVGEQFGVLESLASRAISTDAATIEELDDLWDLRDGVEMILAYLAALAAKGTATVQQYFNLRLHLRLIDHQLRTQYEHQKPSPRPWEPLRWAWWRG